MNPASFRRKIWSYYKKHKRAMPWRETTNPYHILISEVMLQQTQVKRVTPKYISFINRFPSFETLAHTTFHAVLKEWQGLGYNRRAQALHHSAKKVIHDYKGVLPPDPTLLSTLPGIGPNTAGSICAFAYNMRTVFIETNIRAVYTHFFFPDKDKVNDKDILPLIEKTCDTENPREWYYALMDYGAMLKANKLVLNARNVNYKKQSTFKGSNREIRSFILKTLLKKPHSLDEILQSIPGNKEDIIKNLEAMKKEGLLTLRKKHWSVA